MQGGKEKYKFLNRVKRNPFYARWQGKIFIFFSVARENVVLSIYLSIYLSVYLSVYLYIYLFFYISGTILLSC